MNWDTQRTWAQISLSALEHNYRALRAGLNEGCRFLGIVKANAYGHGIIPVARRLQELGCEMLAVACLDEVRELREAGISTPVLILGYTPPEMTEQLIRYNVTQAVSSEADAAEYSRLAIFA